MSKIEVFGISDEKAVLNVQVPPELRAAFKELVFRGTNLWPDAVPAIKVFADRMSDGAPLQDYERVDGVLTTTEKQQKADLTGRSQYDKHSRYLDMCTNCGGVFEQHSLVDGGVYCDEAMLAALQEQLKNPAIGEVFRKSGSVTMPPEGGTSTREGE